MKAVIYARYSSDNQREKSIEGQIRECTAYCNLEDFLPIALARNSLMKKRTIVPQKKRPHRGFCGDTLSRIKIAYALLL